jgi:hypothetical protein
VHNRAFREECWKAVHIPSELRRCAYAELEERSPNLAAMLQRGDSDCGPEGQGLGGHAQESLIASKTIAFGPKIPRQGAWSW